jgi:hypothetical protein
MGTEGRLVHVRRVHPHLMISRAEIQLSEETCVAKLVQESSTTGIGNLSFTVCSFSAR